MSLFSLISQGKESVAQDKYSPYSYATGNSQLTNVDLKQKKKIYLNVMF